MEIARDCALLLMLLSPLSQGQSLVYEQPVAHGSRPARILSSVALPQPVGPRTQTGP